MAPCSGNVITPKMIRTGQVHIGDKIEFEKEENVLVSSPNITSAEVLISSQNFSPAEGIPDVQKVASEEDSFEKRTVNVAAQTPTADGMAGSQSPELTATTTVAMKSNPETSGETPEAASDNVNHVQMVSTSNLEVQPEEKTRGSSDCNSFFRGKSACRSYCRKQYAKCSRDRK